MGSCSFPIRALDLCSLNLLMLINNENYTHVSYVYSTKGNVRLLV